MKKIKILLIVFFAFFIGLINVNAEVLKNGNSSYVMDEITVDCGEEVYWSGSTKEGRSVYVGIESDTHYLIDEDNTCVRMTASELLEYSNYINFTDISYHIEKNDDGEYVIVESTTKYVYDLYIKTEDDTLQDKDYYAIDMTSGDHRLELVTNPNESELSNYYEQKYVTIPSSATIDENETYYVRVTGENYVIKKVPNEDKKEDDILYYYVETNERTNTTKREVLKLDSSFISLIESSEMAYPFYDYNTNSYYIDFEWEDYYYTTYRQDGTMIGTKTQDYIYPLVEDLYVKIVRDKEGIREGFEIYNLNNELLYEGTGNVYLENYKNYKGLLYIEDHSDLSLEYYEFRTYKILSGEDQKHEGKDIEIKSSGDYNLFDKVLVNGKKLNSSNYTVEEGSTIITLKNDYLKTLTNGKYTIELQYSDGGFASTTFEITNALPSTPSTFDGMPYYIVLALISLVGIMGTTLYLKKVNK